MTYRIEEADLVLPAGWRDHSMNVFRLPGAKEAALMVTRDPETPIESAQEYAEQQQALVREQLAHYKHLRSLALEIAARPAWLVEFQWQGGAVPVRQRQAFVHHRDLMLIVTLTATLDTFDQYEPAWAELIGSMKLREAPPPAPAANDEGFISIEPEPPTHAYVFALNAADRILQVLTPTQDPNEFCNAVDVEDGRWEFFNNAGRPLRWRMMQPNRRAIFRSTPGTFDVCEHVDLESAGPPLRQRLDEVPYLKARGALSDLAHIREHLEQAARAAAEP